MTDYVKTADFAAKDGLASGTALKALKGTELGLEFDNIATMSPTKVDKASNASLLSLVLTGSTVPSNGIYLPAANTIGIATNNTQRGTVNATGNWAINVPTSGTALTVNSVSGSSVAILNSPAASDAYVSLQINTSQLGIIGLAGAANNLIGGSVLGDFCIRSVTQAILLSGNNGTSIGLKVTPANLVQAVDQGGTLQDVGWRDMPFNDQPGNYGFVLADRGKMMRYFGAGGNTYTLPANASTAFPVGAVIVGTHQGSGVLTIAVTTDTLQWPGGAGATGSRSIAATNMFTLTKVASTTWWISGSGIT